MQNPINWNLQIMPVRSLKENPKNPRQIQKGSLKKLEECIQRFGLIDKPIVNTDGTIIGGHQRIFILKRKKIKEIECWVPDRELSNEDIQHLCIGLNLYQGDWDYDILANDWELDLLVSLGFDEKNLLGIGGDEDIPEKKEKPKKICPHCGEEI